MSLFDWWIALGLGIALGGCITLTIGGLLVNRFLNAPDAPPLRRNRRSTDA